jgi:hypothetical protein
VIEGISWDAGLDAALSELTIDGDEEMNAGAANSSLFIAFR